MVRNQTKYEVKVAVLLCVVSLVLPAFVSADSEPKRGESVAQSKSPAYQPLGLRAGSFMVYSVIEIGLEQDSNIYRLPDDLEYDDVIIHVDPSITVNSDWNRHALNATASANLAYYDEYSDEDYQDWNLAADGRIDVKRDSYAFGHIGYSHLHEDRNSVDDRFGSKPTEYDREIFGLSYDHKFNRLKTVAGYEHENLDYDDVESIFGGIIDNDDRDRKHDELKLRIGYEVRPQFDVYIEGAVNSVDYDQKFDRNGRERSSDGYSVVAGLSMDITSVLVGDIYLGYLKQGYDDPYFDDIDEPNYGFGLTWYATDLTTISGSLGRAPQETTEPNAAGYLSTVFTARLDHELKRNILLFGDISYSNNDYQQVLPGAKENEKIYSAGIGAKYLFNRRYYAAAEYNYERRDSDIRNQEYSVNEALVSVGAQW